MAKSTQSSIVKQQLKSALAELNELRNARKAVKKTPIKKVESWNKHQWATKFLDKNLYDPLTRTYAGDVLIATAQYDGSLGEYPSLKFFDKIGIDFITGNLYIINNNNYNQISDKIKNIIKGRRICYNPAPVAGPKYWHKLKSLDGIPTIKSINNTEKQIYVVAQTIEHIENVKYIGDSACSFNLYNNDFGSNCDINIDNFSGISAISIIENTADTNTMCTINVKNCQGLKGIKISNFGNLTTVNCDIPIAIYDINNTNLKTISTLNLSKLFSGSFVNNSITGEVSNLPAVMEYGINLSSNYITKIKLPEVVMAKWLNQDTCTNADITYLNMHINSYQFPSSDSPVGIILNYNNIETIEYTNTDYVTTTNFSIDNNCITSLDQIKVKFIDHSVNNLITPSKKAKLSLSYNKTLKCIGNVDELTYSILDVNGFNTNVLNSLEFPKKLNEGIRTMPIITNKEFKEFIKLELI